MFVPVATDPAQLTASKKLRVNPFKTNQEGKLVITESEDVGGVTSEAGGACEGVEEMDTSEVHMPRSHNLTCSKCVIHNFADESN